DNGGDALYAGTRLARRGARVDALLAGSRVHEAGLAALRAAGGRVTDDLDVLDAADLVVDGLLGIGGRGGLREPAADFAARAAGSAATVVAVDLPSGVDASTGEVRGAAVRADVTVTFGTYKPGLFVDPGGEYAGVVEFVDIGLAGDLGAPEVEVLQRSDVAALLPYPGRESDKYRRGVVGVVAGSDRFPGAGVLAVGAAGRSGAGMVRYSGPTRVADLVRAHWPDAIVHEGMPADAGRVQAWVVGPGLDTDQIARERLTQVLASGVPVLVDADGLNLLAAGDVPLDRSAPTLLTPHAGELARLAGADRADVEARRLQHVRALAGRLGVTVLLKGSTTLVAAPGDPVRVNPTGTSWLATAGTGDVLSGLAGALLAQGLAPRDAGSVGAYLHGLAARLAGDGAPIPAAALIPAISDAWRTVAGT
ncbi:MAG: NAD(P)H-hydrate dehydratase, partial [Streptosporangiales bacterium]|nr:NAD(P)H-hydrate dehydratase [Streptosporangiales bacterium]